MTSPHRFAKVWIQLPLVDRMSTCGGLGVPAFKLTKRQEADIVIAKIRRIAKEPDARVIPAALHMRGIVALRLASPAHRRPKPTL